MSPTDFELIRRVTDSDDRASFGMLVLRHQSAVRHFLRHLTRGDHAWADDLAQDTFIRAYRSLKRFRGEASFPTWLLGIAHNHWRNGRRRRHDEIPLEESDPAETSVSATATISDLRHDLKTAILQLSPDEQLALHLGYQQGLSHGEIARLLDWPLGTVKTHLARGKDKLRTLLAPWNPSI